MNSSFYKYCTVPQCKSTSINTPDKLFIYTPHNKKIRKKWLSLARKYNADFLSKKSRLYFCEDHFDLPNDMLNYSEYHIMGKVSQVRMKPDCIPSKFGCQKDRKKRTCSSKERSYVLKKRRMTIVAESLNESESCAPSPSLENLCPHIITDMTEEDCLPQIPEYSNCDDDNNIIKIRNQHDFKIKAEGFELCYDKSSSNQLNNEIITQEVKEIEVDISDQYMISGDVTQSKEECENQDNQTRLLIKSEEIDLDYSEIPLSQKLKENASGVPIIEPIKLNNIIHKEYIKLEDVSIYEETLENQHKAQIKSEVLEFGCDEANVTYEEYIRSGNVTIKCEIVDENEHLAKNEDLKLSHNEDIRRKQREAVQYDDDALINEKGNIKFEVVDEFNEDQIKLVNKSVNSDNCKNKNINSATIFTCPVCKKLYKQKLSFKKHIIEKHDISKIGEYLKKSKEITNNSNKTPLECPHCNFTSYYKTSLDDHINIKHTQIEVFRCSYCPYKIYSQKGLNKHVYAKHGDQKKSYSCTLCSYTTHHEAYLESHLSVKHKVDNGYNCLYCSYKAGTESLQKHIESVHILKCSFCAFTSLRKKNLMIHMNSAHTKSIQYNCNQCTFKTYDRNNLGTHLNTEHTKSSVRVYSNNKSSKRRILNVDVKDEQL